MRGRDKLKKIEFIVRSLIFFSSLFPRKFLLFVFYRVDNVRGNFGILIRYILLKKIALHCGENVSIHKGCYIFNLKGISFGDNVSIHPLCYIDGYGGVTIGSDTSIAHGVTIMSTTHSFDDDTLPIKDQPIEALPTSIGRNVWIGAKAMIKGGIVISDRSIVGASAVVTKNIDSNTIVGGNPARIIKLIT